MASVCDLFTSDWRPYLQLDIVAGERLRNGRAFRDKFDVSVCLTIWGDIGPTIIRKLNSKQAMPNTSARGRALPLLWSSTGHIFLAFGRDGPMQQMLKREFTGRRDFGERANQIIEAARRPGFAWSEKSDE